MLQFTRDRCLDWIIYTAAATQRASSIVIYIGLPLTFCYLHSGSDVQRAAKKVLQLTIDRRWDSVIYTAAATNSARSVVIYIGSATWCHQSDAKGPHRDDAFDNFLTKSGFAKIYRK